MIKQNIKPEATFKMYELISGYWIACGIHALAQLQIADLLADGPKTINELAEISTTHAPSLYRLLRAVTSVGIFEEMSDGKFQINELGKALLTDTAGSVKPWALANLGEHFPAFGNLAYGISTGEVPFDQVHGMSLWDYYKTHPLAAENVTKAMAGVSGAVIEGITEYYDFSPYKTLVDIGGGNGALMFGVLQATPNSEGIVFDEPYVIEQTKLNIPDQVKNRCHVMGGSFFETVPEGADLYMTKWVLHDWNDEQVMQIFDTCFKAMKSGSKLLIIESVLPDEINTPHAGKLLDLNIFAMTKGKERTVSEFKNLVERAGLRYNRLILTNTELSSIIECEKL